MKRLNPIDKPDVEYQRTLTPVNLPDQPLRFIDRFPTYYSILRDKKPDDVYNYHGIFVRDLYTRINLRYIPGVYPIINR